MAAKIDELKVPPEAHLHGGTEVLRAFIIEGGLTVSLRPAFEDAAMWGMLLVDIARHAARMHATETSASVDAALKEIKEMFDAEWSRPTDFGTTRATN